MWMLGCCACEKQAVLLLAVLGRVCKKACASELQWNSSFLVVRSCAMLWVQPAGDLYALPRALPNVRERGTLLTDRALHVPNPGRTPLGIAFLECVVHGETEGGHAGRM